MSTYGYEKHDAGAAGQFTVTITTPGGVTGRILFTRTEGAAAAIAGILQADQDRGPIHPEVTVAQPEDPGSDMAPHLLTWRVSTALTIAGVPADEVRLFDDSAAVFTSYTNVLNTARNWVAVRP